MAELLARQRVLPGTATVKRPRMMTNVGFNVPSFSSFLAPKARGRAPRTCAEARGNCSCFVHTSGSWWMSTLLARPHWLNARANWFCFVRYADRHRRCRSRRTGTKSRLTAPWRVPLETENGIRNSESEEERRLSTRRGDSGQYHLPRSGTLGGCKRPSGRSAPQADQKVQTALPGGFSRLANDRSRSATRRSPACGCDSCRGRILSKQRKRAGCRKLGQASSKR